MKNQDKEIIPGIVCSASSCKYNTGSGGCAATQVAIGPSRAACCADTVCATFEPDSEEAQGKIFK